MGIALNFLTALMYFLRQSQPFVKMLKMNYCTLIRGYLFPDSAVEVPSKFTMFKL